MNDKSEIPFEGQASKGGRLFHIIVLFGIGFVFLFGTLAWLQLVKREEFVKEESHQIYRRILKEGARGSIYDRNGVLLAGNKPQFTVGVHLNELREEFITRRRILRDDYRESGTSTEGISLTWMSMYQVMQEKMDEVGQIIGREIELDKQSFQNHYFRRRILPFQICENLDTVEYARLVEGLSPDSPVQIYANPVRYYPFGNIASHVIGHVGRGETESISVNFEELKEIRSLNLKRTQGKTGLEASLDAQLRGGIGWEVWSIDPLGFQFDKINSKEPAQGSDLHTTLDIDIQMVGETAFQGKIGALAAISVEDGEVLALVSKPNYDLNLFTPKLLTKDWQVIEDKGAWLDRCTQGLYPPGSTFKIVTALSALNDHSFDPNRNIYCGPYYTIGERRFPENRTRGHGYIGMVDSIAKSSNVYFYQLGLREGIARIARQAKVLGLGAKTGIELPGESPRTIVPDKQWKLEKRDSSWLKGDTANVSIGQGYLLVTPLQMARLTAAVANRRESLDISLLKGKTTSVFKQKEPESEDKRFDYIFAGMRKCVLSGTGKSMKLPDISIAAKTGTAQVFPNGKEENLAWVIAFAPVEDPKIAVAVVVEDIGSSNPIYGGSTAGPIASAVIQEYFDKYLK